MAIDAFLELVKDGSPVAGESQDALFKGLIEIDRFSIEARRDLSSDLTTTLHIPEDEEEMDEEMVGGLEMPTDSFTVEFTKDVDTSSPELFTNYCQASDPSSRMPFDKATFYFRIAGPSGEDKDDVCFLKVEVTRPYVSYYHLETRSTSIPQETVRFLFETYEVTYRPQKGSGALGEAIVKSHDLGYATES